MKMEDSVTDSGDINGPEDEVIRNEPEFIREPMVYTIPETTAEGLFQALDALERIGEELRNHLVPQALEKKE